MKNKTNNELAPCGIPFKSCANCDTFQKAQEREIIKKLTSPKDARYLCCVKGQIGIIQPTTAIVVGGKKMAVQRIDVWFFNSNQMPKACNWKIIKLIKLGEKEHLEEFYLDNHQDYHTRRKPPILG